MFKLLLPVVEEYIIQREKHAKFVLNYGTCILYYNDATVEFLYLKPSMHLRADYKLPLVFI